MSSLRNFTNARVGLGRVGDSLPTAALLDLRMAQARARDAVHLPLASHSMAQEFAACGWNSMVLTSQARSREEYLLRPDLGRSLSERSHEQMVAAALVVPILFCVGDGLCAAAIHSHAVPLLKQLQPISFVAIIEQARVAVGDPVGALVQADISVMLIGERPGLSSPDSLGVYITYRPRPGRTDAERNCVSNIHQQGLSYEAAAQTISYLMNEASRLKLTGVALKDRTQLLPSGVHHQTLLTDD